MVFVIHHVIEHSNISHQFDRISNFEYLLVSFHYNSLQAFFKYTTWDHTDSNQHTLNIMEEMSRQVYSRCGKRLK